MIDAIKRNAALAAGVVLAAVIAVRAMPFLISTRGDEGPTIFQSQSPILAVLVMLVMFALMTVVAALVGRYVNAVVGLFALGAGLFVLNGRLDTVEAFAFANSGVQPRWPLAILAIETFLLAVIVLAITMAVFIFAGRLKDIEPDEHGESPHPLWSVAALKSAAAGAIVILAVIFIAQSPMKGQMVGATFVGGMLAGVIGRLISPHVQPILLFASPILFGAIGYVVAMFMINVPLDAAYVASALPALARPMPLDYAVGSLTGVAFGLGWARSFLQHDEQPAPASVSG